MNVSVSHQFLFKNTWSNPCYPHSIKTIVSFVYFRRNNWDKDDTYFALSFMSLQEKLLHIIMFLCGSSNDNQVSQTQTQHKCAVQVCQSNWVRSFRPFKFTSVSCDHAQWPGMPAFSLFFIELVWVQLCVSWQGMRQSWPNLTLTTTPFSCMTNQAEQRGPLP